VKEIFSFLKGTDLVPVEMELVPEFGSLPSPRFIANYEGQNICVQYASQSVFAALFRNYQSLTNLHKARLITNNQGLDGPEHLCILCIWGGYGQ